MMDYEWRRDREHGDPPKRGVINTESRRER